MLLPSYLFSAGLGSKLSTWLTPPHRKIQMTDFALGGKCGLPSGRSPARATPSLKSRAPRARPVKPNPVSARKERRVTPGQRWGIPGCSAMVACLPCAEDLGENIEHVGQGLLPKPFRANP